MVTGRVPETRLRFPFGSPRRHVPRHQRPATAPVAMTRPSPCCVLPRERSSWRCWRCWRRAPCVPPDDVPVCVSPRQGPPNVRHTRVRSHAHAAGTGGRPGLHQGVTLLVVAHPDDESMCAASHTAARAAPLSWLSRRRDSHSGAFPRFFAPTVAALTSAGVPLHVLCLSTGAHTGS